MSASNDLFVFVFKCLGESAPIQNNHGLDMGRMREHVYRLKPLDPVAACADRPKVLCQGLRITRHIDRTTRTQPTKYSSENEF